VEDDAALAHFRLGLLGVNLLHKGCPIGAEDVLHPCGVHQLFAELLITNTRCPEDSWVRRSRASTGNSIVVYNTGVVPVDLKALEAVLVS